MADNETNTPENIKSAKLKLGFTSDIRRGLGFFNKDEKELMRETAKDLALLGSKMDLTQKIMSKQTETIMQAAMEAGRKSEGQEVIDILNSKQFQNTLKRLQSGESISASDAKRVLGRMEKVTEFSKDLGIVFESGFKDISSQFSSLISSQEIGAVETKELGRQFLSLASEQGIQSDSLAEIEKYTKEDFNLTQKDSLRMAKLMNDLADDTTDIKIKGTLQKIESTLGGLTLSNNGLAKALEEEKGGVSLKDRIPKLQAGGKLGALANVVSTFLGFGDMGGTVLTGAIAGLGLFGKGLTKIFAVVASVSGFINKILISPAFKSIRKLKSVIMGSGKLGPKMILKGLGKATLIIGIVQGVFDFFQGMFNAGEIAGLKEGEIPTIGQRVMAGISNTISGLTFGLLSAEEAFKGVESFFSGLGEIVTKGFDFIVEGFPKVMSYLFDEDKGIFAGFFVVFDQMVKDFGGLFEWVMDKGKRAFNWLSDFVGDIFDGIQTFWSDVGPSIKATIDYVFGEGGVFTSYIWPIMKSIGESIGEGVVTIFSKLGTVAKTIFGKDGIIVDMYNLFKALVTWNPKEVMNRTLNMFDSVFAIFDEVFDMNLMKFQIAKMVGNLGAFAKALIPKDWFTYDRKAATKKREQNRLSKRRSREADILGVSPDSKQVADQVIKSGEQSLSPANLGVKDKTLSTVMPEKPKIMAVAKEFGKSLVSQTQDVVKSSVSGFEQFLSSDSFDLSKLGSEEGQGMFVKQLESLMNTQFSATTKIAQAIAGKSKGSTTPNLQVNTDADMQTALIQGAMGR